MPAYSPSWGRLIRIVNIFPGNRELERLRLKGQVPLMDDRNGEIVALMDLEVSLSLNSAQERLRAAFKLFAKGC